MEKQLRKRAKGKGKKLVEVTLCIQKKGKNKQLLQK